MLPACRLHLLPLGRLLIHKESGKWMMMKDFTGLGFGAIGFRFLGFWVPGLGLHCFGVQGSGYFA